jgi:3-hydroxyacyl-CoA dehydrogenase
VKKMIRTLKTGLVAAVVGAVVVSGVALAQTDETPDVTESPAYTRIVDALGPLVESGTITQGQADAIAQALAADARGLGGRHHRGGGHAIEAAAEFLGMDVDELRTQLHEGATLAEIAGDQADALVAELVSQAEERVAEAVETGRITQEQADEKLAEIEQRITDMVNGELPERGEGRRGPGRRGPGGPGSGPGFGGDAPAEDAVNA